VKEQVQQEKERNVPRKYEEYTKPVPQQVYEE
jgi:hypothetical protein